MRQANSTIKGYLYQFNKSIFEILNADDDATITLEGVVEDIDIEVHNQISTIQCKYHEDGKFSLSNVATPILEMVCHYLESITLGKKMKYILYAYYSENVEEIDTSAFEQYVLTINNKEMLLSFFHKLYKIPDVSILDLANKPKKNQKEKEEILKYYESNRHLLNLRFDWKGFWDCFQYTPAEKFDILKEKAVQKLCEYTNRETAEDLYYPNAFSIVANISAKPKICDRIICKKQLIYELNMKKSVLITKWLLIGLDRKKILKSKKTFLTNQFSLNTAIRAFVFSEKFCISNKNEIIPFILEYIAKYFKKRTLQRPPLFIFENGNDFNQKVILELYKYQKVVNCGFVGSVFMEDSFINNDDCSPEFVCKVATLEKINTNILEKCNVNQLYIIGNVTIDLNSQNYSTEIVEIEEINELRYLVNLIKNLEVIY